MRQITFANQRSFEKYARPSRREQFLDIMETVVPWSELDDLAPRKRTPNRDLRRYRRSSEDGAFTEVGLHVRVQA